MAARTLERRIRLPRRSYKYPRKGPGFNVRSGTFVIIVGAFICTSFLITLIYTNAGLNAFEGETQRDTFIPVHGDPMPIANIPNEREDIEPVAADSVLTDASQERKVFPTSLNNVDPTQERTKGELKEQKLIEIDKIPLEVVDDLEHGKKIITTAKEVNTFTKTSLHINANMQLVSSYSSPQDSLKTIESERRDITELAPVARINELPQQVEKRTTEPRSHQRTECKVPKLDPFDSDVLRFLSTLSRGKQCHGKGFFKLEENYLYVDHDKKDLIDRAEYRGITATQGDSTQFILGTPVTLLTGKSHRHHINHDFIQVDILYKGKTHLEFLLHVTRKPIPSLPPNGPGSLLGVDGQPLNVIVLLVASATHAHFQRKLGKVYSHLKNDANTVVFDKYISSGRGLLSTVQSFLYGGPNQKEKLNIFQEFKKHGYVTMYSEDSSSTNALFQGKTASFVDNFAQPFWQVANKHYGDEHCLYNPSKLSLQLNYIKSLYEAYPDMPIFAVTVLSEFQYDGNSLSNLEEPLLEFFSNFEGKGYSMDTIFILAGDSGEITTTNAASLTQLKLEARLPFLSITYPRFTSSHDLYENFNKKRTRLITPFDIHVTLRNLLNYPNFTQLPVPGINIFSTDYPQFRSCKNAGIESKLCPCYLATTENPHSDIVRTFSRAIVGHINHILDTFLNLPSNCLIISLKEIFSAEKLVINYNLRGFDFAATEKHKFPVLYDIRLGISPHGGSYTVKLKANEGRISLQWITRVMESGEEMDCNNVKNIDEADLCFCRK